MNIPDGKEIHIPYIECEDCGEPLTTMHQVDERGNIWFRVFECEKSRKIRWKLQDELLRSESEKKPEDTTAHHSKSAYIDGYGFDGKG